MSKPSVSISQHYHQRTKYDPETLKQKAPVIDWNQQPSSLKEYKIGKTLSLKPYLDGTTTDETRHLDEAVKHFRKRLSRLLLCSYGVTVKVVTRNGEPLYFRAAPSAGALYPAEVYVLSRGTPMLPAGLFYYHPLEHALIHFWDSDVWTALQQACFWHPSLDDTQLALVTTGVYFRSVWRYQARAYRRILLDTGHLLGNIELAAAVNQFRPHLIGGFADDAVNQLLYLDPPQEGAIAVMALADLQDIRENLPEFPTALPSAVHTQYPTLDDDELLHYLHRATEIPPDQDVNWKTEPVPVKVTSGSKPTEPADDEAPLDKYNFPFCLKVETAIAPPMDWGTDLLDLEATMLKRRSTRQYTGANLSLDELKLLLDFTYQPQHYAEQGIARQPDFFSLGLIETFVAVSGVEDLDEGCYYYAPHAQELRQIRFRNFRRDLHFLCLGQDLGRDAAAVIFHTADLKRATAQYGDRVYRYLHMDAGHLGQRLNLAGIRLGLGVSGIGGFFDDKVNDVLGIPSDEAVLYITTLGRPRH